MATGWFEAIDNYCERTDASLWAEPLNAFSNLAFIAACVAGWWCYRRRCEQTGRQRWEFVLLLALLGAIGIGSFLFHTFATRWAFVADVVPIALFQFAYVAVYGWHMLARRWWVVPAAWAAFIVARMALAVPYPPGQFNGSAGYFSSLLFIALMGGYARHTERDGAWLILLATPLFMAALYFRSIDLLACDDFPLGTHSLWHVANGGMLYCLFAGLVAGSGPDGHNQSA
uniref:Conserved putative membrane protein n=3 Tax=environmental samples TaxID=68359 RepID=A0A075HRI2_9EURY|nr:conserved putative membrane protein [uncultured marine group II/III euryarchaeote KM3_15_B02]AIF12962.1 conserved putative membrane protein [uncultured marine group II/III euryarchaeote KM3_59_B11]AIF17007.1 conserved putative membrane protein [uncultured marine group II/III euryarchaeote KM3_75_F08]